MAGRKPDLAKLGLLSRFYNKRFTVGNLKTNWELIPLFTIPCCAVAWAIFMLTRTATTAPDIRWMNKGEGINHDAIRPDQDVKLHTQNPEKFERIRKSMTSPKGVSNSEI